MTAIAPNPSTYRGRFAPSPTGLLHFGSLVTAFGSWLLARHAGGEWLVRIEDLDPRREVPGVANRQLRTLAAFGMESDGPVLRQSLRGGIYQAALDRLLASGDAFACQCSRRDLAVDAGVHRRCTPGTWEHEAAIRFRVPPFSALSVDDAIQGRFAQDVSDEVGDFVLKRADGPWAYQLAVVVDDAAQGITDVVRGADLLDSTPRQILLQRALGLTTPRHAHLPLVVDGDRHKLSKSLAALPVDEGDPLPALRSAWGVLGQSLPPLAGAGSLAILLKAARREFDPRLIPQSPQRPRLLSRNVDATEAD